MAQNFWPGQIIKTPEGIGKVLKVNPHGIMVILHGSVEVYYPEALDRYKQNLAQPRRKDA